MYTCMMVLRSDLDSRLNAARPRGSHTFKTKTNSHKTKTKNHGLKTKT